MKQFFQNDYTKNSSSMRLIFALVVLLIMIPWCWFSLQAGNMIDIPSSVSEIIFWAFIGKGGQKGFEAIGSALSGKEILSTVKSKASPDQQKIISKIESMIPAISFLVKTAKASSSFKKKL